MVCEYSTPEVGYFARHCRPEFIERPSFNVVPARIQRVLTLINVLVSHDARRGSPIIIILKHGDGGA